ncbi:hypothetical protein GJV14_00705 [Enterobacteriaceae bacterium RIT697]|nr:hypothetical protein [Enterobacteriaceae bacterium RIT697]
MQTSFHIDVLDASRVPDVSGQSSGSRQYSASEESLDALKARTTPIDNTNPYVSPHASCAHAFLATAISIEHRYDEIHLQLPVRLDASLAAVPLISQTTPEKSEEVSYVAGLQIEYPIFHSEPEIHWNFDLLDGANIPPLSSFELSHVSLQTSEIEIADLAELNIITTEIAAVLLPLAQNAMEMVDMELMDLVMQEDAEPMAMLPMLSFEEVLESGSIQNELSAPESWQYAAIEERETIEDVNIVWH